MSLEFLEKQSLEFGKLSSNTFHEFVEIMNNNQIYTWRIPRRLQVTMVKKKNTNVTIFKINNTTVIKSDKHGIINKKLGILTRVTLFLYFGCIRVIFLKLL